MQILLCAIVGCLPLLKGYPQGPPIAACGKQIPNHGFNPQMSDPPYRITVSNTSYSRTGNITVTVEAVSTYFNGFLLQARRADCTQTETALGRFFIDEDDSTIKLLNCTTIESAVCHASKSRKVKKTFLWTNSDGQDVYFRSTFVRIRSTFWVHVESPVVRDAVLNSGNTYQSCNRKASTSAARTTAPRTAALLLTLVVAIKLL